MNTGGAAAFFTFIVGIAVFAFMYGVFYDHMLTVLPEAGTEMGMYTDHIALIGQVFSPILIIVFIASMFVAAVRDSMIGDNINLLRTLRAGIYSIVFLFVVFIGWMITTDPLNTIYTANAVLLNGSQCAGYGTVPQQILNAHRFIFSAMVSAPIFIQIITCFVAGTRSRGGDWQ